MKRNSNKRYRFRMLHKALAITSAFVFSVTGGVFANAEDSANEKFTYSESDKSYFVDYSSLNEINKRSDIIELLADNCNSMQNPPVGKTIFNQRNGILLNPQNSWCEWTVEVGESGVAGLEIDYAPTAENNGSIIIGITIDGKFPFSEAENYELNSVWKSTINNKKRSFEKDSAGNEIRPTQKQSSEWISEILEDSQGLYDGPYLFNLDKGIHTVRINVYESSCIIGALRFSNKEYISYSDYYAQYSSNIARDTETTYIQAELPYSTSSSSIYPTYDKTNAATVPNSPKNIMMNIIGGSNWSQQGESISWSVDVPKAGMYKVALRARQNVNAGLISYRRLSVNGEIPFSEALNIPFKYSQDWEMFVIGENKPMLIYLEPGDTLTLSCTTGETAGIIRSVKSSLSSLNEIYRKVIAITSVNPDVYQDYKLETKLPALEDELRAVNKDLNESYENMHKILNTKGSLASSIKTVAETVELFANKPYIIPENLSLFKSNLESLGSLITSLSQQPLEIDYIAFMAKDSEVPSAGCGFFETLSFTVKQFLCSFTNDYSSVGSNLENAKTINVWVSTGRDQAQVIERLISSDFTVKNNIGVDLNLVDTGTTLIRATLAGKGPDAALMIPSGTPVELAARGALIELNDFITNEIYNSFHPSAWTPFRYDGKIYAVPESQIYPMIFYRKDIFEQLGIEVPETWEDFYNVMEIIQMNNLSVGLPEIDTENMGVSASLSLFSALLMQNGCVNYYNEELTKTNFDSEIAFDAFTKWARIYTDYGVERDVNVFSRFRTGEIPLAIRNFSDYAQIQQAAPEIRGLWGMAPIPGIRQDDGNILRTETSTVTGCIMMKAARKHGVEAETAKFLNWWISSDIQSRYGSELEISMGIAGRYYTANLEAFKNTDWTNEEYKVLNEQLQSIINQPTVPGNYAVGRDLTSALREVISGDNRPRRALMLYNTYINEEIMRKRIEFGLEEN